MSDSYGSQTWQVTTTDHVKRPRDGRIPFGDIIHVYCSTDRAGLADDAQHAVVVTRQARLEQDITRDTRAQSLNEKYGQPPGNHLGSRLYDFDGNLVTQPSLSISAMNQNCKSPFQPASQMHRA